MLWILRTLHTLHGKYFEIFLTTDNPGSRQQTLTGLVNTHDASNTKMVLKINSLHDTNICLKNEAINTHLLHEKLLIIRKTCNNSKNPSVEEYKGVQRDAMKKFSQKDCVMSVAATLTFKEVYPRYPHIFPRTVFNKKKFRYCNLQI